MLDINLDKNSQSPLYRQLGDCILEKIITGKLPPDCKLPPIRALSQKLSVNNTTVVGAYKYLENKRVVYSIRGSGTYVAKIKTSDSITDSISLHGDDYINFAGTNTSTEYFPVDAFRHAFDEVLKRDGGSAFDYQEYPGYAPLREVMCDYLGESDIFTSPEQVRVFSDMSACLEALARGMSPGDTIITERPCAQDLIAPFIANRIKVADVPLNDKGPDLGRLSDLTKQLKPKYLLLMPNFQMPTGMCYDDDVKLSIIDIAQNADTYIIEADSFNDFFYDGRRRVPIKAMSRHVIYLKNFSKMLTPGLGLCFMVSPSHIPRLHHIDRTGHIQRVFDFYLRHGGFAEHMEHMRDVYGRRYRKLVSAAATYLAPFADFTPGGGGLGLWVSPKNKNIKDSCGHFLSRKVVVSPGQLFAPAGEGSGMPHFRMSFANVPESRIAEGAGVIASVLARGAMPHYKGE